MNISDAGLDLIREFESCRLEAYQDSVGIWTLGFGHTKGVQKGDTCTQEEADQWLREDCHNAEKCVNHNLSHPILQNEFDALVCFVFNVGCGNFGSSTLLRLVNDDRMDEATAQFPKWNHAGGQIIAGLTRRREAEAKLFQA